MQDNAAQNGAQRGQRTEKKASESVSDMGPEWNAHKWVYFQWVFFLPYKMPVGDKNIQKKKKIR